MRRRKKGDMVLKIIVIILMLFAVYLFYPYIDEMINHPPSMITYTLPERMDFTFERIITIDGTGTYILNLTIPTNNTLQSVYINDRSGYTKDVIKEFQGSIWNRTVWSYDLKGSSKISIVYSGSTYTQVWKIDESDDVNAIPQDLKDMFNHREYILVFNKTSREYEKSYVIDPAPFKSMTERLTKEDKDVVSKLRTIYDTIVNGFQYSAGGGGYPNTAVKVWELRKGDCDELSFVFISMARSIGIPAWMEYGLLYTGNSWIPHGWVGAVIPVDGKLILVNIDLTIEVGDEDIGRGFLVRPADRLLEWRDDGNSEHLTSYYNYIRYTGSIRISQQINIIKAETSGTVVVNAETQTIPSWVMVLIFILIIVAAVAFIIKL